MESNTSDPSPESRDKREKATAVTAVLIVVMLWAGSACVLGGMEDRGTFGDMFGAINALFSGLAVAGLIYTILLQQQQIRETNAEYRRNAQAQKDAAKLEALSVLFEEFVRRQALNDAELKRYRELSAHEKYGNGLGETLERERRDILQKRNLVYDELVRTTGLAALQADAARRNSSSR